MHESGIFVNATPSRFSWFSHVYREHNQEADYSAGRGAAGTSRGYADRRINGKVVGLRGFFDGSGGKTSGEAAASEAGIGWVLYAWYEDSSAWTKMAHACRAMGQITSTFAELNAMSQLVRAVDSLLCHGEFPWSKPGWN